jgi:RimJ/RimL family protein N-acetyltransferase
MEPSTPSWKALLLGERVRLEPIDSRLARAMLAGVPDSGVPWAEGFPLASIMGIARTIAAASKPPGAFGAYVIVRQSDGLAVGDAGFHGPPNPSGEVELGYALVPAARGAGLASEAVSLLIALARSQPAVRVITARVDARNAPSERLLVRLGFELGGDDDGMRRFVLNDRGSQQRPVPGQPGAGR